MEGKEYGSSCYKLCAGILDIYFPVLINKKIDWFLNLLLLSWVSYSIGATSTDQQLCGRPGLAFFSEVPQIYSNVLGKVLFFPLLLVSRAVTLQYTL